MLIKKSTSDFKFKFYLKKKNLLIATILILNALLFTYVGIKTQTRGNSFLIKKFIIYDNQYRFKIIKNYIKKPFIKIDKVYLDLDFKTLKKIDENRITALEEKQLTSENNKNVDAVIRYNGKNIPIKIKLKGGMVDDHLKNKDQISYKVNTKKSNVFGFTKFSLMHAQRRNFLLEWYSRKLFAYQGLIYKDYKFINLYINGENKGLYVIDEGYTNSLSIKNKRKEGLYIRYGTDISIYNAINRNISDEKDDLFSTIKNLRGCCGFNENLFSTNIDALNQQINSTSDLEVIKNFNVATKLLQNFRENKSTPAEIFNLDLMAKGFALSDILGSWHSSHWSGMNFYFDPISKKLEPIFEDNYNENSTYPSKERAIRIDDTYNYSLLYKRLFNSKIFLKKYIYYQNKYSDPAFLKKFNVEIKKEFEMNLSYINKFKISYFFPFHIIEENRKRVEKFLRPYQPLYFSLWDIEKNKITLKIGNTSNLPIKIEKIEITDDDDNLNFIDLNYNDNLISRLYLNPRFYKKPITYKFLKINSPLNMSIKKIDVHYKVVGLNKIIIKTLKYPLLSKEIDKIDVAKNHIAKNIDTTSAFKFLKFFDNKILIPKGNFIIDKDLIIPKNKELIISAGSNIDLTNGSKIISYSRIIAEGSPNNPIKIWSSDNLGECILISETQIESIIKYVYFKNLSNCSGSQIELTGSINFYNTNVIMDNVYFINNLKGDDYLNIINSKLNLNNIFFQNSHADALDIDYSIGKIENIKFNNIGNDAIDLSNSSIELNNFQAEKVADKAISVGENSYLRGNLFKINGAFLGLAIKDQSEIDLNNLIIKNSNIPLATYIKKKEYNSSKLNINKYSENNNLNKSLFEEGSDVIINKIIIKEFKNNIFKTIYPKDKVS